MEKVITAGVLVGRDDNFERSMRELAGLCEACDMEVVAEITQTLEFVNKATYMGSGKVEELRDYVEKLEADLVVFDDSLTPSQLRNLSDALGCGVMDRSTLILQIFSRRAKSHEAKLQVEVASLQYMLPRLVGLRDALSRQGGTSGSMSNRGAGETKLELDRRRLEARLTELRRELKGVAGEREVQRKQRNLSGMIRVALVGYTNAGKSTLMNALLSEYAPEDSAVEEKLVFEQDMLFATLDTTVRKITPPNHQPMLVSDTVGFIDKLPHHLVEAFKSTLEEACEADVILNVIDSADEDHDRHIEVTQHTLSELGAGSIPVIKVYNKADKIYSLDELPKVKKDGEIVKIYMSAANRRGVEELLDLVEEALSDGFVKCKMLIPYTDGGVVSYIKEHGVIYETSYEAQGTLLSVNISKADYGRYERFVMQ